jgi:predicted transcriptional regulator/N-acetylglutamate synthase-like GNAT family acetyltransferase
MISESMTADIHLTRITAHDVSERSDVFLTFRDLIIVNEPSYPGIRKWLDEKVAPGVRSEERSAFIAFADDKPVATAVVKRGGESKFCHLRISDEAQDRNLGELLFALMAAEVRHGAMEVHFTLPESLWIEKEPFFTSFGFSTARRAVRQYRLFEDELRCSADFDTVWRAVLTKLPKLAHRFAVRGHAMTAQLLLSIAPRFAQQIFDGRKRVEVRRRFSKKWAGTRGVVYSSSPEKRLLGEVAISNVVEGTPQSIWNKFSSEIGCTQAEFDAYVSGSREVFALIFSQVVAYAEPIPLSQLEFLLQDDLTPPQSYCTTANTSWSAALAIAALLHGRTAEASRLELNVPSPFEAAQMTLI